MNDTDTTAVAVHDAAELTLPAPAIEATRRYLQAQVAPATLRAYQSDFAVFAA
ncbi:hypothetical protein [Azohydromonas aeria]|uniref:hypothetical protein n=1 Tax=Azohydromonas aeria TaxID=2590212 RepID=UPI0012F98568|nr:hypothetical protein [Azohydromonas aeria]